MKNWFIIFILMAIILIALFLNFNFPKKIYLEGDKYIISKFLDFLNSNNTSFKVVDKNHAKYIIDFNKLKIDLYNGLTFYINWNDKDLSKCLQSFDFFENCHTLINSKDFYLYNALFYKPFTISLSCGINIIVSPSELESLEYFVYRTFYEIIKGDYSKFENGHIKTEMYVYIYEKEPKLIGIYDPKLDVLETITNTNVGNIQ